MDRRGSSGYCDRATGGCHHSRWFRLSSGDRRREVPEDVSRRLGQVWPTVHPPGPINDFPSPLRSLCSPYDFGFPTPPPCNGQCRRSSSREALFLRGFFDDWPSEGAMQTACGRKKSPIRGATETSDGRSTQGGTSSPCLRKPISPPVEQTVRSPLLRSASDRKAAESFGDMASAWRDQRTHKKSNLASHPGSHGRCGLRRFGNADTPATP